MLPHEISKGRNRPLQQAIQIARLLSLFTLHVMRHRVFTCAESHKKQPHAA